MLSWINLDFYRMNIQDDKDLVTSLKEMFHRMMTHSSAPWSPFVPFPTCFFCPQSPDQYFHQIPHRCQSSLRPGIRLLLRRVLTLGLNSAGAGSGLERLKRERKPPPQQATLSPVLTVLVLVLEDWQWYWLYWHHSLSTCRCIVQRVFKRVSWKFWKWTTRRSTGGDAEITNKLFTGLVWSIPVY